MTVQRPFISVGDEAAPSTGAAWLKRMRGLALVLVLLGGVIASVAFRRSSVLPETKAVESHGEILVGCLGHIEPQDGVILLGARSQSGQPSLVAELRVKEGDRLEPGQIVAFLNSKDELEAQWRQAEANVALMKKRLEQVKAGAKSGDLHAQEAEIARLKAELANAETENRRREALFSNHVTAQSDLDASRTQLESARQMLQQAQQRLDSLAEVRKVDVSVAEGEIQYAIAQAKLAHASYEAAVIRSPIRGSVIKIQTWPGEEVGEKGIMEIGKTNEMYVFAEVPEEDVSRLKVGDQATISSASLAQPLHGSVEWIGMKVAKDDVLHIDPATLADTRVVEVKIRLNENSRAAMLIHAQVNVVIKP